MDFLPQTRPQRVLNSIQMAEITFVNRATGKTMWRAAFRTCDPIPIPPLVAWPDLDYTVIMTWQEDWRETE